MKTWDDDERPEAPTLLYAHEQAGYVKPPATPPKTTNRGEDDE